MTNSTFWWLLAGAAIVLELLSGTGTLYLLLISGGFIAAALAAHLGFGLVTQLIAAALVSVGAVFIWRAIRSSRPPPRSSANRDINLDIGERVHVDAWNPDGTASVRYRGAQWTVVPRAGATPTSTGEHKIIQVIGSRFVVEKV